MTGTHRTSAEYKRGCRCEACKDAYSIYQRAARKRWRGKHPYQKRGRKVSPEGEAAKRYAIQFGVSLKRVRILGVANLDRMTEDARRVMFNSFNWDMGMQAKHKPQSKQPVEETVGRVSRLMRLAERIAA